MIHETKDFILVWGGDVIYWAALAFMVFSTGYYLVHSKRLRKANQELLENHKQLAAKSLVIVTELEDTYRERIENLNVLTKDLDAELNEWRNRRAKIDEYARFRREQEGGGESC